MSRITDEATLTQLRASASTVAHLGCVELDAMDIRITDSFRNISWGGDEYLACGDWTGFDPVEEQSELQVSEVEAHLSGVDQSWISDLMQHNYLDRRLRIWRAWLDEGGAVVGQPVLLFDGRMDQPTIADDPEEGSVSIAVSASSHWVDFEQTNGLRTNHSTQQRAFPGDLGFEFAAQILEEIKWGRE